MDRQEFVNRCREAIEISGKDFRKVIGRLITHFSWSIITYEDTGLPDLEKMPEGMAEMYIALMMLQLKYNINPNDIEKEIAKNLTKQ